MAVAEQRSVLAIGFILLGLVLGLRLDALAAELELRWTFADGRNEVETRALPEKDGVSRFVLTRDEIAARGAASIEMTPDFARAQKGDSGFWAVSSGEVGTFRCDDGRLDCNRWQLMSFYGMQTPERTFIAIVRRLKYYFTTRVVAEKGAYRMSCVLEKELASHPYEDFEIEFRTLRGREASLGGIARAYRQDQLERGAVKPFRERVKDNPVLKAAIEAPEVRIRQAWKPVPSPIPDQTPENEPAVKPVVSFDRVTDIAREFRRQGVEKAEFCLVGWQIGGHDGRWPQVFPVEPSLGGEDRLRACIRAVKDMGYLIVPHGNYLDAYRIAESWDEEWLAKGLSGEPEGTSGNWGGGRSHRICAKRTYERFMSREMPRMKALGFKGLGYFDVASIVPADLCTDPRHPLSRAEAAQWWGRSAELSKRCFGGFASEGTFDHFAGSLDYGLYASFNDPQKYPKGLVDRMAPLTALVYNGIFASNPFTRTVNFTAQDRFCQLKLIEFGGRPCFYYYSKFVSNGKDWMGDSDLHCGTDEELRASVARVKAGWEVYRQLNHLQFVYMDDHAEIAPGVWRTSYENGEKVLVNYNKAAVVVEGVEVPAEGWKLVARNRLQALLDKGGDVVFPAGDFEIAETLVIRGGTHLTCRPGFRARLADGANCPILANRLRGAVPERDISICGGLWDGNNAHQVRSRYTEDRFTPGLLFYADTPRPYGPLMVLSGIDGLVLRDMTLKDPQGFCVMLTDVEDFTVTNIVFDCNDRTLNEDGIHVNGFARHGRICGLRGHTNDDLVALNSDEGEWRSGDNDIEDIHIEDLDGGENGYTAVRLLSRHARVRNVTIRNIRGKFQNNLVSFTHWAKKKYQPGMGHFDNILIEDVTATSSRKSGGTHGGLIWFQDGVQDVGDVTIRHLSRVEGDDYRNTTPTIEIGADTRIRRLTLNDVTQRVPDGKPLVLRHPTARVENEVMLRSAP